MPNDACLAYAYIENNIPCCHKCPSTVSVKKIPPLEDLWQFFQKVWEFFDQILHAYYVILSTLDYEFLFNYLQL